MGVSPRGAQVRRFTSCSIKPVSSRKTTLARRLRSFFDAGPVFTAPPLERFGILLAGDSAGLLRAEAELVQNPSDVPYVVLDAEALADQPCDAVAGPQVGREARRQRPSHHQLNHFIELLERQLAPAAGVRLGRQGVFAPSRQARRQRLAVFGCTPKRSATMRTGSPAWKHAAARRRRASSSAALPVGLMKPTTVLSDARVHSPRGDQ